MGKTRCSECVFFEPTVPGEPGECRRGPPTVFLIQKPNERAVSTPKIIGTGKNQKLLVGVEMDYQAIAAWPPVTVDQGCGSGEPIQKE